MDTDDLHVFRNDRLTVAVKADGAELTSIRTTSGHELLWQAGPEWPRHAPVLFPIVGRLQDDTLHHHGRDYRLTQHGFARDRRFAWEDRSAQGCRLSLHDDDATRAMYPFAFGLTVAYALEDDRLLVEYEIHNPGTTVLPASLGAHPAFRWPLADGLERTSHRIVFAEPEPAPVRRVAGGLLQAASQPTPVTGNMLPLSDALFIDDALILDRPASRALRFESGDPEAPALEIDWHDMPQLGLWSKPGAAFLCIEPWAGLASPAGFDGEFMDKPLLMHLPPGHSRRLGWSVRVRQG